MPKPKRKEAGSLPKSERQKPRKLYKQGGVASGSVRSLVEARILSLSKVRPFLLSKTSYVKFSPVTGHFKKMKATAGFQNENCCLELAYVGKLAKEINGVKSHLSRCKICFKERWMQMQ